MTDRRCDALFEGSSYLAIGVIPRNAKSGGRDAALASNGMQIHPLFLGALQGALIAKSSKIVS
jgi:hypothetical protein